MKNKSILIGLSLLFIPAFAAADESLSYTLPSDGRVSLAIYNKDGQLVRTLLTGKPLKSGQHQATWDGLDRYGNSLPSGEYDWKLLATTGLRAEFITQVGQNPDPIWEKGVCNHEPPMAAAVDASGVYRIGTFDEGAHAGVKTDLSGRYLWTTNREKADPWCPFGAALTLVDGTLYDLIFNGTIYRYEAASGRCLTSSNGDGLWNIRYEGGPAKVEGKPAEALRRYIEKTGVDISGASSAKLLVVSYRQHDAVRWFSVADGKPIAEASVPNPVAVAARPDGTALVISNGAVLAVSRDGRQPQTLIPADQLNSPWRLCESPASGDIFIAENSALARQAVERAERQGDSGVAPDLAAGSRVNTDGEQHHQVKRFSAQGKLLASFGRPEGRQDGLYDPTDFRGITDIEADADGGFVVTEGHQQPPRRSARFDASGKVLREWLGAAEYGILACPEPSNPEYVWIHANGMPGGMIRCKVDYANKTWAIVETYREGLARNPFWGSGHQLFRIVERDGKLHFFGTIGPFLATVYDPANRTMHATNAGGRKSSSGDFWNDLNDDGLVQPVEMMRVGQPIGGAVAGAQLSLFTTPHPSSFQAGPKLAVQRFTAGGTPIYVFDKSSTWPAWKENEDTYRCWDIISAPDGGWYACFSDGFRAAHENGENHGPWYMNSNSGIDRLVKWDPQWRPLWSVGRHSSDLDHETGSTAAPRGLVGATHGCIVWAEASDEELARCTVWTDDGLYVDEFLRVPTDKLPKEMHGLQNGLEFTMGHLIDEPGSGQVLYYAVNTAGGSPIYRISGWDNWHRQSGRLTLAKPPTTVAKRDGTGLKAEYFTNGDCSGQPAFTRTDKLVYFHWLKDHDKLPAGIDAREFSCRWTGQVEAPTTDRYRLVCETLTPWRGGGWGVSGAPTWLKLWIGGTLIIDTAAGLSHPTSNGFYGEAMLTAGRRYDLRLECGYKDNAIAKLCWETASLDRRAILPAYLHPTPGPQTDVSSPAEPRPQTIAEFSFEEGEGNLSYSRESREIFGRLTGNTRRVQGKSGEALEFHSGGRFDPALFPIDEELRLPDTNYTIAFWFKTTSSAARLCEAKRYSPYNNRWSDHVVSIDGGKLRFSLHGDKPLERTEPLNDGQWHHLATTVGPGGQRLYADGKLISTGNLTHRTKSSNRLGLDVGPSGETGTLTLDELKIFAHPLTDNEIATLAEQP